MIGVSLEMATPSKFFLLLVMLFKGKYFPKTHCLQDLFCVSDISSLSKIEVRIPRYIQVHYVLM